MPANTAPIYGLVPNIGFANISTTSTLTRSDGVGTIGTNLFKAFTAGVNGSFIQKVRFLPVANTAAVTTVATTLRVFISTVGTGSTTAADTYLIGEVSVPGLTTAAANSTAAVNYYELPLNFAIPSSDFIYVGQHVAQTTNQNWLAVVIGSDY
jgi:hypothetical protein